MAKKFEVKPIGYVRKEEEKTWLEINNEFGTGLDKLEEFSHVIVLWWIEGRDTEADRNTLRVHPKVSGSREESPETGVFASRSPGRPNPIGLTISKILSRKDNILFIDRTDAFDDTPILDLKPYIPNSDCIISAKVPDFMKILQEPRRN